MIRHANDRHRHAECRRPLPRFPCFLHAGNRAWCVHWAAHDIRRPGACLARAFRVARHTASGSDRHDMERAGRPGRPRHTASWRTASQSARFRRGHTRAPGARYPSLILPNLLRTLLYQPFACKGFPRPRGDGPLVALGDEYSAEVPPPARGWSRGRANLFRGWLGSPARAGMVRNRHWCSGYRVGFPRPRGDGPHDEILDYLDAGVPPPARGWSLDPRFVGQSFPGSPARAGMVPRRARASWRCPRFPRPRGDGPASRSSAARAPTVPPPARGWSAGRRLSPPSPFGSPARAGMVRHEPGPRAVPDRFPRPRGDGPLILEGFGFANRVPPPARGWSLIHFWCYIRSFGSPARAGMVLVEMHIRLNPRRFPRPRGDGPDYFIDIEFSEMVPPPARGWSLVRFCDVGSPVGSPARAGMVPSADAAIVQHRGFPRPRGDGPRPLSAVRCSAVVPPPARGWSRRSRRCRTD